VREIFQEYRMTTVPCVPDYILGVVNVRGEILSVTDPAKLMRLGFIDTDGDVRPPAIVIVKDEVATALVVDEIGDIAEVPYDAIEPPVSIIDRAQAEFISGSVHVGEAMVGLISIERMLEPVVTGGRG
jgi:purine-binding chemotaxis protein CheW